MEKKEFYTPQEKYLIEAMKAHEERAAALKTKETTTLLLELDEKLLAMEEKHGMIDGLPEEAWLL